MVTEEAKEKFVRFFTYIDWEKTLGGMTCPSQAAGILHKKIEKLNDLCFPWKDRKIRSTDKPWITDNIRRKIRSRMRCYKKHRRGPRWQLKKKETDHDIEKKREEYFIAEIKKLKGKADMPFKALRHVTNAETNNSWNIRALCPGRTDVDIAEDLASFFCRIADEFTPINIASLPTTFEDKFPAVGPAEVAARIRSSKKPLSAVEGDPIPAVFNTVSDLIAIPTCRIINHSFQTFTWPAPWQVETQTPLPKTQHPESFDDLRNVSCTNHLSKIMETFLLERLQKEVKLKYNQFGGIKKTGTTHFLIETYQRIIDCLEDGMTAVSLVSIDFSKAFNRMSHRICVEQLAGRGASTDSIRMVGAFLNGRKMRMKINNSFSKLRPVLGGAPQGTKVGNYLFTVTIEGIKEYNRETMQSLPATVPDDVGDEGEDSPRWPARPLSRPMERFCSAAFTASTPTKKGTTDGVIRYWDTSGRSTEDSYLELQMMPAPPPEWVKPPPWADKYVDDLTVGECLFMGSAISSFSTKKERRSIRTESCEDLFGHVKRTAESIGMKVNEKKTALLCVSTHPSIDITSYITAGDATVESGKSMKILGFVLGSKGDMTEHVHHLMRKFGMTIWSLRNLKKAKMKEELMTDYYTMVIRPMIEYALQVYHFGLTVGQSERIEGFQRLALKIIYGFEVSYRVALERSGLERLADRQTKLCLSFAVNPRYDHWFPTNNRSEYNLRTQKKFKEEFTATERRWRSPIFALRRLLNEEENDGPSIQ